MDDNWEAVSVEPNDSHDWCNPDLSIRKIECFLFALKNV